MSDMVNVAVDAMGGDNAPDEIIKGAVMAVNESDKIKVYLVGKSEIINEQLKKKDSDIKTLVLLKDSTEQLVRQLETEIRKRDAVKAKGKAEDTQIVKLFAQMAEDRTRLPATDNWAELFKVMDNHFPSFTLQIKSCRSIGKNEYQVCVLTKLGFRVSDIAYLTNNSSNSITNLRSRMMVKLFGEEGGAKDFDAKIASL
jgi:DNA-binding NarL/FixJ family response regulator